MRLFFWPAPLSAASSLLAGMAAAGMLVSSAVAQSLRAGFTLGGGHDINTLAVQSDGGIIVGGAFRQQDNPSLREGRVMRLHPSGEADLSFQTGSANDGGEGDSAYTISSVVADQDDSLVVGGSFFRWNGVPVQCCVRLRPWGSLAAGFQSAQPFSEVAALKILPDRRLLVAGGSGLYLLNPEGGLQAAWPAQLGAGTFAGSYCRTVDFFPDGAVITGGSFDQFAGQPRKHLAWLLPNGLLGGQDPLAADAEVRAVAVQPDGKVLVGGAFGSGTAGRFLLRFNADGTPDATFTSNLDGRVNCIKLQPDGRILVGGEFMKAGALWVRYLARLRADGSVDSSFWLKAEEWVDAIELQPDGRILATGYYQGSNVGRFYPDGRLETDLVAEDLGAISSAALQADGNLVFGQGKPAAAQAGDPEATLRRLYRDGTPDPSFVVPVNAVIRCVGVQSDGGVVFGGDFTQVNSVLGCGWPV